MKVSDRIYGEFDISESVIERLISTDAIQRLKKVHQHGIPPEFTDKPAFSRYEHSVGTMLILRVLGAELEEQVAGLLHDVSHTAFSHIVDWVLDSHRTEDFQDKRHRDVICTGDISTILTEEGFDPQRVAMTHNFRLLDAEIPDVCADRFDYAIREFDKTRAKASLGGLISYGGKMAFRSASEARAFADGFLDCQLNHWGELDHVLRYRLFADTLRLAINEQVIDFFDLLTDDEQVMAKLRGSGKDAINAMIYRLSRKLNYVTDENNPDVRTNSKFRHVDPTVVQKNSTAKLSEIDSEYKVKLLAAEYQQKKGISIRWIAE